MVTHHLLVRSHWLRHHWLLLMISFLRFGYQLFLVSFEGIHSSTLVWGCVVVLLIIGPRLFRIISNLRIRLVVYSLLLLRILTIDYHPVIIGKLILSNKWLRIDLWKAFVYLRDVQMVAHLSLINLLRSRDCRHSWRRCR